MTSIARRTLSSKLLRDWNILRPFHAYFPQCKLSTNAKPEHSVEDAANEKEEALVDPLTHPDFFQVHNLFTVKDLFNAKVHYGHKEGSLNKNMRPFVFGSRLGHLIIDLDQTAELLRQALNFAAHIAFRDGIILFIARNPQVTHIVEKTAFECKEFSHTRYWKRGLFTNSVYEYKAVTRLPDMCIFFNTLNSVLEEHTAVGQCAKLCIPTIGIVDTNCNPNLITYPVPGNDDTPCAIELYCKLFKAAIMRGKATREQLLKRTQSDL